mmetsp:Transcript_55512/g.121577  ORF Transcript_55512/g.121577 Transcript_55512/m.121577 type:complete len:201 (+) Transcript_55512:1470-2072(+)
MPGHWLFTNLMRCSDSLINSRSVRDPSWPRSCKFARRKPPAKSALFRAESSPLVFRALFGTSPSSSSGVYLARCECASRPCGNQASCFSEVSASAWSSTRCTAFEFLPDKASISSGLCKCLYRVCGSQSCPFPFRSSAAAAKSIFLSVACSGWIVCWERCSTSIGLAAPPSRDMARKLHTHSRASGETPRPGQIEILEKT